MATNPQEFDFDIGDVTGEKGDTGNGIKSIQLLSTSGLAKTYRITMTDGTTFDFVVTDGNGISGATFDAQTNALTITFDNGTSFTTPSLKGDPGSPGDDGYSPAVTITTITGGHRVTITDKAHPSGQSFDVMDGEDGGGDVTDVQINGTSIVTDGVANVPIMGNDNLGLAKTGGGYGIGVTASGILRLIGASNSQFQNGINDQLAVKINQQHISAFYALAKAAGDTTQSQSSNPVGTYTDEAKAAIKSMLGVADGGGMNIVSLSGTQVTQVGADNTFYVCGELTELTFTAPAVGITMIRFTSGTTPTVLTISGVTAWMFDFDPTVLEANTTYDISVLNGIGVAGWA